MRLTSQTRSQPVIVAVQQPVQNPGEDCDVVLAVIWNWLLVPNHRPVGERWEGGAELYPADSFTYSG